MHYLILCVVRSVASDGVELTFFQALTPQVAILTNTCGNLMPFYEVFYGIYMNWNLVIDGNDKDFLSNADPAVLLP